MRRQNKLECLVFKQHFQRGQLFVDKARILYKVYYYT
jgi:hypothetical protein